MSDCNSLEIICSFDKDDLDIAHILVEDGYQATLTTLARRIGGKICALCLKRYPMHGVPRKLLRQHKSVVLWPHYKADTNVSLTPCFPAL